MASPHQQSTEHPALSGLKALLGGFSSVTRNMQAIAGEIAKISEDSLEAGTKATERLRNARSLQEVTEIQSDLLKDSYAKTINHYQKIAELALSAPQELASSDETNASPLAQNERAEHGRAEAQHASDATHEAPVHSEHDGDKTSEAVEAALRQARAAAPL
jgi:hypothetical protein